MDKLQSTIFYIFVVSLMTLFARCAQSNKRTNTQTQFTFYLIPYFFSFFCAWFVISFTRIGTDYENYTWIIKYSKEYLEDSLVEAGFNGLSFLLLKVFNDTDVVIFMIKTITIAIFYFAFYQMCNTVPLWLSVLTYGMFLYLRFYLLSMMLVAALIMLSIAYLLKNRNLTAAFVLIVACFVHSSCIFLIPTYVLYFIICKKNYIISKTMIFAIVFVYTIVILFSSRLVNYAVTHIAALAQYAKYDISWNQGIGILLIVRYLPLIYFLYLIYNTSNTKTLVNLSLIFILTSLFFDILGYKYSIVSRMSFLFLAVQCLMIPAFLNETDNNFCINGRLLLSHKKILWFLYILVIGAYNFYSIINSSTSKVNMYVFFNPFR